MTTEEDIDEDYWENEFPLVNWRALNRKKSFARKQSSCEDPALEGGDGIDPLLIDADDENAANTADFGEADVLDATYDGVDGILQRSGLRPEISEPRTCEVPIHEANVSPNDLSLSCYLTMLPESSSVFGTGTFWAVCDTKDLRLFRKERRLPTGKNCKILQRIIPLSLIDKVTTFPLGNRILLLVRGSSCAFDLDAGENNAKWTAALIAFVNSKSRVPADISRLVRKEGLVTVQSRRPGFNLVPVRSQDREYYAVICTGLLQLYHNDQEKQVGCPVSEVRMHLASVKPASESCEPTKLELISAESDRVLRLSFPTVAERDQWFSALAEAVADAIMLASGGSSIACENSKKIFENPSNTRCADCESEDPKWASINMGITICENCAGCHRALGVRFSKVRSIALDTQVWDSTMIEIFRVIGNDNANKFWEFSAIGDFQRSELRSDASLRMRFIRKKYEKKSFCYLHGAFGDCDKLNEKLFECIDDEETPIIRVMELLFSGASVSEKRPVGESGVQMTAIEFAKHRNRPLIAQFLILNQGVSTGLGAVNKLENMLPQSEVRFLGIIYVIRKHQEGFKKRYAVLDQNRFAYYRNDILQGEVSMDDIVSIDRHHGDKFSTYVSLFTADSNNKQITFSADSDEQITAWFDALYRSLCPKIVYRCMPTESKSVSIHIQKAGHVMIADGDNPGATFERAWMHIDSSLRALKIFWNPSESSSTLLPDLWIFRGNRDTVVPSSAEDEVHLVSATLYSCDFRQFGYGTTVGTERLAAKSDCEVGNTVFLATTRNKTLRFSSKTSNDLSDWLNKMKQFLGGNS